MGSSIEKQRGEVIFKKDTICTEISFSMKFLLLLLLAVLYVNGVTIAGRDIHLYFHFDGGAMHLGNKENFETPKEKKSFADTEDDLDGVEDVNAAVKGDDYALTVEGDVRGGALKTASNADTNVGGNILDDAHVENGEPNPESNVLQLLRHS